MDSPFIIALIIYGVVFAIACSHLAEQKGKDSTTWAIVGFFLGIIGLLIIGFSESEGKKARKIKSSETINVFDIENVKYVDINCPIEVYKIHIDKESDITSCLIYFKNLSNKVVSSVKFQIKCYDSFGNPVSLPPANVVEAIIQDETAEPKKVIGINVPLINHSTTRKIDVVVTNVLFSDNTTWEKGENELIELKTEKITDQKELNDLQSIAGNDAVCYAKKDDDFWTCICGRLNKKEEIVCKRCDRGRDNILENYLNKDSIKTEIRSIVMRQEQERKENKEKIIKKFRENKRKIYTLISLTTISIIIIIFGCITDGTYSYKYYESKKLDNNGNTALINTIVDSDNATAKKLIDKGADLNLKNKYGNTALIVAVSNNNIEVSKMLIDKGADLNVKYFDDCALTIAIKKENVTLVKLLIDSGAELNSIYGGVTALSMAKMYGNKEIYNMLKDKGAVERKIK